MASVQVQSAPAELLRLIERALAGEDIVLSQGSRPVVRLVPVAGPRAARVPGSMKGRFEVGTAFFDPLDDDELAAWGS